jgi:hypothetical protein
MAKRHTDIPRQPVHKWASAQFGSYSRKSDAGAIGVGEPPDRPASGPRDQGRSADQAMRSRRPQISRSGGRSKAILWLIPPLPPPRFSARNGRYGTPGGVCLACARKDLGHLADVFSYVRLLQAGLLERTREAQERDELAKSQKLEAIQAELARNGRTVLLSALVLAVLLYLLLSRA